jgi:origin recognition complex subunit 3
MCFILVSLLNTDISQGVYVYQPAKPGKASGERPSKRRKVSSIGNGGQQSDAHCFLPLLNGEEPAECVQLRHDTYKQLWSEEEDKIQVRP